MRRIAELLKFTFLLGLLVFLFGFGKKRNDKRKLTKVEVEFVDSNTPFITYNAVNKLLIQNNVEVTEIGKETLVLKEMENRLRENPMVREAQVFVTIDGVLGAKIEQRDPVGRISRNHPEPDYYLDAEGREMPLSTVYSARVPLVTGISPEDYAKVSSLLLQIRQDDFMRHHVVGLHQQLNGEIELELRKTDAKVLFGKPRSIARKFQNFKAFYKKTNQDSTLYGYNKINLKFESQVIATKKQGHGK